MTWEHVDDLPPSIGQWSDHGCSEETDDSSWHEGREEGGNHWHGWPSRHRDQPSWWQGHYEDGGSAWSWHESKTSVATIADRGLRTPEELRERLSQPRRGSQWLEHDAWKPAHRGKDPPCPSWDGSDFKDWPQKRIDIDRWSRLTQVPPEEMGERLLLNLTGDAALATKHLKPSSVSYAGGLNEVVAVLDKLAFPEVDAERFHQLERTIFCEGRGRGENIIKYANRVRAEQRELERLMPGSLDSSVQGFLLLRGANLGKTERNNILLQTNYSYKVEEVTSVMKRMTDDSNFHTTKSALMAGTMKEETHNEAMETDYDQDMVYAAIAELLDATDGEASERG